MEGDKESQKTYIISSSSIGKDGDTWARNNKQEAKLLAEHLAEHLNV